VTNVGTLGRPRPGDNRAFFTTEHAARRARGGAQSQPLNHTSMRVRWRSLRRASNVLQALILTDKDESVLTPTSFLVFFFFLPLVEM